MIDLRAGDYRLVLEPARGGSVARFDFGEEALFRPTCGPSVLDTACFPLVPFSNRIAQGVFHAGGQDVRLAPNFPGAPHPHTLHGFGWLCEWQVIEASANRALLRHAYVAGEWPWDYVAEQRFDLSDRGLTHRLTICNRGNSPMPAGLGLHPEYPHRQTARRAGDAVAVEVERGFVGRADVGGGVHRHAVDHRVKIFALQMKRVDVPRQRAQRRARRAGRKSISS